MSHNKPLPCPNCKGIGRTMDIEGRDEADCTVCGGLGVSAQDMEGPAPGTDHGTGQ